MHLKEREEELLQLLQGSEKVFRCSIVAAFKEKV